MQRHEVDIAQAGGQSRFLGGKFDGTRNRDLAVLFDALERSGDVQSADALEVGQLETSDGGVDLLEAQLVRGRAHRGVEELDGAIDEFDAVDAELCRIGCG